MMTSSNSSVPDAWHLAVQDHLATLSSSQKAVFKAPASADDCMTLMTTSQRRRGFSKLLDMMKPVIEPLKRFEGVMDVIVQTNAGICSPIWGPLRMAVMIASDHFETLESLAIILQRIVASLERFSNYEILFENHLNTKKAIGALYGQILTDVQQWLSPSNVQDDLFRHQSDCMSGTCNWAFEKPELWSFLACENSNVLRIGGAPGAGKSTLPAFIIHHLTHAITGDVLYFFCKATDTEKRQPFQALRTLLSQLLVLDDSLYPWFETLYQNSGHKTADSFANLQYSLQLALSNTSKPLIHVVVDALDECQQAPDLVNSLITALRASRRTIKVILTTREDPELLNSFCQPFTELIISPTVVSGPVWEYVKQRVSHCKSLNEHISSRVHFEVCRAAGGLWLYAKLMMDEIQRLHSISSIERQLRYIPNGLAQLYTQIFATMDSSFSPLQLKLSQQVFLWLNLEEFVHVGADSMDREVLGIIFQAENFGEEVFDSIDLARQLCSPLIRIFELYNGGFEVNFIHHTASQFVQQCSHADSSSIPRILKPQRLKELYRGATSVWFFTQCAKSTLLVQRFRDNPYTEAYDMYFEFNYGLWNAFFLSGLPGTLDEDDCAQISEHCNKLTDFLASEKCLRWIETAIIINYAGCFINLRCNAIKALAAAQRSITSSVPGFQSYSAIRQQFFADYVYVLYHTGPTSEKLERIPNMPKGFQTRPLAVRILALGNHWKALHTPDVTLVQRNRLEP